MEFFLTVQDPSWLSRAPIPFMISRRRLVFRRMLPRALEPWALESSGAIELTEHGQWKTTAGQYADEAERWQGEIGGLAFAAVQDWGCDRYLLDHTGLAVREHQERTIASFHELRSLAPTVPWAPVLQGLTVADYLEHARLHEEAGIDLAGLGRVCVGSIYKRSPQFAPADLFAALRGLGLRLHGLGIPHKTLRDVPASGLESCDSLAWSFHARQRRLPLVGCTHTTCASCFKYAMKWRESLLKNDFRAEDIWLS